MNGDELPEGWIAAALGDVADVQLGKMLDRAKRIRGKHLPYLRNASVRWGAFDLSDLLTMPFESHELERYSVQHGDLLVCEGGEPGRAAVWAGGASDIKYQKAILRVRPGPAIADTRWIMYSLRHDALSGDLEQYFTGSTIKHFPRQAILQYEIRIPPPAEQKRIVAKTDELLARVNGARERLARVPAILKRFRQAVLAAACEGRLTEGWRTARTSADVDDADLPRGWKRIEAGAAYLAANYGTSVKCDRDRRGVPVLRVPNIASGRLDTGDLKFAPKGSVNLSSLAVSPGDVLICRTNGSLDLVGKAALVPVLPKTFSFASYLIRVRLDAEILRPALFHLFLLSPVARDQIEDRARTTAGQFNLNLQILRGLEMPLPPPDEQDEIVRRVEALFKLADAIDKRVAAATARAERLTQAILAKAFRGELVPTEAELARREGRAYEPASALLEPNPC